MLKRNPLLILLTVSVTFFLGFVLISFVTIWGLNSRGSSSRKTDLFGSSKSLGVIEVSGVITDSKKYLDQIEKFEDDKSIKGVLVRINSPGGAVGPSQEIYSAVRDLAKKKPVYSSMSSVAASGGYYIAAGTKKIFANPGTITGSIGVIMPFMDMSALYSWAKVKPYNIKTGKFKDTGSPAREMSPEEKHLLQVMLDNVLGQFRRAVATGRSLSMEKVIEVSDGRILSGEQAKNVKLVDEMGGIREAIDALAKEVGITGKPKLVYGAKKKHFYERFISDEDEDAESSLLGKIGKISGLLKSQNAPQGAYFLMPDFGGSF